MNQDHDGAPPAVPGSNGTVNLARKAWPWVGKSGERDGCGMGVECSRDDKVLAGMMGCAKGGAPNI